jgi:hypothetical protein
VSTRQKLSPQISLRTRPTSRYYHFYFRKGYGIGVKPEDIWAMKGVMKMNVAPECVVPFHIRAANETAFKDAFENTNRKMKRMSIHGNLRVEIKKSLNAKQTTL